MHLVEYQRTPSLAEVLFGVTAQRQVVVKLDGAGAMAMDRRLMDYWAP